MLLDSELVMELTVELTEVQEVGQTIDGILRLIPIIGGVFTGPNICGKVIGGGYDWNTALDNGVAHVFAKYALQTDDGVYISIENEGYLGNDDNLIKTNPRFKVQKGKYEWLNTGVFVGSLEGGETEIPSVKIKIYKLK